MDIFLHRAPSKDGQAGPDCHGGREGFTLIELLVVVVIIGVLTALTVPVVSSALNASKATATLANMKQLTALLLEYMSNNNGLSPEQGNSSESWASVLTSSNYWYNALPRMGNMKGVADFAASTAGKTAYYTRQNLIFCSGAVYPSTKLNGPLFPITLNSKLIQGSSSTFNLGTISQPSRTVAFLENGLTSETNNYVTTQQSGYNGNQPYTFASRFVARYNHHGVGILSFFDGHAAALPGGYVVCTNGGLGTVGKAYFPEQNCPGPEILWCQDPGTSPN